MADFVSIVNRVVSPLLVRNLGGWARVINITRQLLAGGRLGRGTILCLCGVTVEIVLLLSLLHTLSCLCGAYLALAFLTVNPVFIKRDDPANLTDRNQGLTQHAIICSALKLLRR